MNYSSIPDEGLLCFAEVMAINLIKTEKRRDEADLNQRDPEGFSTEQEKFFKGKKKLQEKQMKTS